MLLELEKRFCSEESRIAYLAALRWPGGWSCPRCSATEGWTVRRNRWRCGLADTRCRSLPGSCFRTAIYP
ncbi:MAG: transposase [Acidobacteriaceae bacterium]